MYGVVVESHDFNVHPLLQDQSKLFLTQMKTIYLMAAWLAVSLMKHEVEGQSYNSTVDIMKDLIENGNYHTEVRPLKDQSKVMRVFVDVELVSIVGIDDVAQSFTINGFVIFNWLDEILVWDPKDYGNQTLIHPVPEKIWRPRVFLLNTLGDRDLFKDDVAPAMVTNSGYAGWVPGSLIPASCELHLEDYPFDQQTCTINFVSMSHSTLELVFVANSPKILLDFFIKHGEWELKDTNLTIKELVAAGWKGSTIELKFELKRRPTFLLINIVLPVVFLSFLNILVFIIPADSGEKISYGITVLLALSVFLSIVGSLLPRSGEATPKLTIYLFLLLIISMLTVIDSIIIVYLAHKDEQETMHRRAKENFQSAFSKTQTLTKTVSVMRNNKVHADLDKRQDRIMMLTDALKPRSPSFVNAHEDVHDAKENKGVNKYRLIGKHIDCVSLIVFLILWLLVTLSFLFDMAF
ncbi:acetylcholine receptor subunit alpha-like isoform X2 [Biomphalaria glabrata]|uniref:Acetylcholine receptor subunit alpha-like isoform X2 n=1 Tax=Biomphalaria glabrata TaxID=6526 RepID=A0A9W3B3R5_BIOGL|nr:acetylcholine receptor subunit alpha-like isoform X2 [Biomphalaria glabrata]